MSTNLLDETVEILEKYGKTLDDVLYIQGDDFEITKKNFPRISIAGISDRVYQLELTDQ